MKKLIMLLFTTLFLLLTGCENKEELQKEQYIENARTIQANILASASEGESIISIYSSIWTTAIANSLTLENYANILHVDETDLNIFLIRNNHELIQYNSYSKISDFNLAIELTQKYLTENQRLSTIETSRQDIQSIIKTLNSPPNGYERLYDELFELYENYEKYIELAISPSGSLANYNNDANQLSSEIVSGIKKVEAKFPE